MSSLRKTYPKGFERARDMQLGERRECQREADRGDIGGSCGYVHVVIALTVLGAMDRRSRI